MRPLHAVVVRTTAYLAAAAIALRVLLRQQAGLTHGDAELVLHGAIVVTGVAVGLLAHGRQAEPALRALAAVLVANVVIVESALLALYPGSAWQWGAILLAAQLVTPFLGAWSWRWQGGMAAGIVLAALAALVVPGRVPFGMATDMLAILSAGGIVGIVGANLVFKTQLKVATSESRYRALFRWAGDAIVAFDQEGRIVEANAAFDAMVESPPGATVGTAAISYLDPVQPGGRRLAETFPESLRRALGGEAVRTVGRLRRRDGQAIEVSIHLNVVHTEHGSLVQAILRDQTAEARLARHAEREARLQAMRRLAGGIAHEFNNLLAGVRTNATVLRDRSASADQAAQLDDIVEATRRGAELARELLQFGQQQTLNLDRVPLEPLLDTIRTFARAALLDAVEVRVDAVSGLPDIRADREALLHAALQIALNARDAITAEGSFTVTAAQWTVREEDTEWPDAAPGRYVRLAFQDTGAGMDEETLDRVFEPFFSTRPLWAARGTGLSAVYGIVRAHQGSIRMQSRVGRGTTVHLLIPVWRARLSPVGTPQRRGVPARANVLLVDDDDGYRRSIARALATAGYVVTEAADADEALVAYAAAVVKPDIALLDFVMPGGGPLAFAGLRAQRPDLPILICTGHAPEGEGQLASMLNERDVRLLRKPFDLQVLFGEVAYLLGETD